MGQWALTTRKQLLKAAARRVLRVEAAAHSSEVTALPLSASQSVAMPSES